MKMLNNFIGFFRLTDYEKVIFEGEIRQENIRRTLYLLLIDIPASAIPIIIFSIKLNGSSGIEHQWRLLILAGHSVLFAFASIMSAVIYFGFHRPQKNNAFAHVCIALIIVFLLFGGAFITAVDQLVTSAITPYLLTCFIAGLVFIIRPLNALVFYIVSYLIFSYGISITQSNYQVLMSNYVNGAFAAGLGLCMSFILWKGNVIKAQQNRHIQEQNVELMKSNSDKDRFMSILAHDLRGPFSSILGLLEVLKLNIRKYEVKKTEHLIDTVYRSAQNTYGLLEDLLMWARSKLGKIPFEPQKHFFHSICSEILYLFKPVADKKGIIIKYFADDNLVIYADLQMIKTILRNLVSNAIKFTNAGGKIEIYALHRNSRTIISVSDSGIGMSPDMVVKLFDISQPVSTPGTAQESGTGLGLFLCKEFIEKHGGKIWVESEVGKGSIFYFSIPVHQTLI